MSPLEELGLPESADERMVKRAYAQRLRDTRPDSDPDGFQRLHATYQAALAQCQRKTPLPEIQRAAEPPTPAASDAPPSATADAPQETVAFSFDHFTSELLALATQGDAARLSTWLGEQPALWSLRMKSQVSRALFAQLHRDEPPMPPDCIRVLLTFFDLDQTFQHHEAMHLQQLVRRMQLAWELQPAHRDALAERMTLHLPSERRDLATHLKRLARPLRWPQVARIGLMPKAASSYVQFIQRLSLGRPEDLPEPCDQEQIRFWLKATDTREFSKEWFQLAAARCIAVLLGGLLLGLLSGALLGLSSARFHWTAFWWCFGLPALFCAGQGLFLLMLPLDRWHGMPEYQPARWPWLNLLLVPVFCAVALASGEAGALVLAFVFALAALWLAFRRLRRRNTTSLRINPRLIWFGLWGIFMLARSLLLEIDQTHANTAYSMLAAATAMLLWAMDLWRQRHGLRVRQGTSY